MGYQTLSQNQPCSPLSRILAHSFITVVNWVSQLCLFLNACCLSERSLYSYRWVVMFLHFPCKIPKSKKRDDIHEYISSMLTYVSEHHKRQTRSTVLDLLHIPRSHSAYFDRAFSVQGPKLWDSLPGDIRNSTSINRFKRELKRSTITKMHALNFCCISNRSSATVRCGGQGLCLDES